MRKSANDLMGAIRSFGLDAASGQDGAHDGLHLQRVVANALALTAAEVAAGRDVDAFVVETACWLHDCVQLPKGTGAPGESARQSAHRATERLTSLGVAKVVVDHVASAIETHSFSAGRRPQSLEAAIVQDADRLDALGAIGIARLWVTGAAMGGALYHDTDPAGCERELDDRAFGLDHIERKLLKLPDTMTTAAGRVEAEHRAELVRRYRDEFLRELG